VFLVLARQRFSSIIESEIHSSLFGEVEVNKFIKACNLVFIDSTIWRSWARCGGVEGVSGESRGTPLLHVFQFNHLGSTQYV